MDKLEKQWETMEDKRCAVFLEGKECGLPLTLVDLEGKKVARYDLVPMNAASVIVLEPK
jgi:hypothetical protein